MGQDFSNVRIHTGINATNSAQAVQAKAFTLGNNIVFNAGQYAYSNDTSRGLLAHELTHVLQQRHERNEGYVQRQPTTTPVQLNQICYRPGVQQPIPSAAQPELHPTYEQWLSSFTGMIIFHSNDTVAGQTAANRFRVLGRRARRYGDTTATAVNEPIPVSGRPRRGEQFIDHPANQWVTNCLPANLRATAYQLPADCADIAVILRHVWLAAHHRTELYSGWTVGDAFGRANQPRARELIGDVYSRNVAGMVNAYSDQQGQRITNFNTLVNLLHPGDILVWEHRETYTQNKRVRSRRTGGHTQTINNLTHQEGRTPTINVLQGNQPIFGGAAVDILRSQGVSNTDPNSSEARRLRNLPGRRIESSTAIGTGNIQHPVTGKSLWGEIDSTRADGSVAKFTILVAAGPPKAAARPAMRRIGGQRIRRISDWFRTLRRAPVSRLYGVFEAALLEARSIIDGGGTVTTPEAQQMGIAAGESLWSRARSAARRLQRAGSRYSRHLLRGDVGHRTHFEPLHRLRAMIRALGGIQPPVYRGNPTAANQVKTTFTTVDAEFNFAARGGSSVTFNRGLRHGDEIVKVLVTGFDPYGHSPPRPGDWNPSGAAATVMDGTEIGLGGRNKAAIEGVVYPVSFAQFGQGIVESVVQSSNADAILTVSLEPNLPANSQVQIEQFTVGTHELRRLQPHRLFFPEQPNPQNLLATELRGVPTGGAAIIETAADLPGIAQATGQRTRRGRVIIPQPIIARGITLRFSSTTVAQRAIQALGLTQAVTSDEVVIDNVATIRAILANAVRISDSRGLTADIRFIVGGQQFRATVVEGPGGNFLSNEVAYRTQRELARSGSSAVSFHTHTPPAPAAGETIPQTSRIARRNALWVARNAIARLVTTLRRMIVAVGVRVLASRQQGGGP